MERVLTVDLGEEAVANLSEVFVINDALEGMEGVVFWTCGTASALDNTAINAGQDVGAGVAFRREVAGQELEFRYANGSIVDRATGMVWNTLGQAVSGRLKGTQLEPVVSINYFWFSWAAFKPDTRIYWPLISIKKLPAYRRVHMHANLKGAGYNQEG